MDETRRRFEIGARIGEGGFGEVYQATMVSPGGVRTEVALKVLHKGLDPRSQPVQRLSDEAKLLGLLNHPSILRIHDLVLLDDRVTLVTEFVHGADLDRCAAAGMGPRAITEACGRVAGALREAHVAPGEDGEPLRLLHRDIKPSNIRVGRHGEVKLLDFGIAKAAGQRSAKTQTSAVIGSFGYMAPERLDGEAADGPAGDVFALGVTLWECLTCRPLFDLSVREVFTLGMNEERQRKAVDQAMQELGAVPPLDQVLREMLAYTPEERPSLQSLEERLEDVAEGLLGQSTARWSRGFEWPPPSNSTGELSGRSITEVGTTADAWLEPTSSGDASGTLEGYAVDDGTAQKASDPAPQALDQGSTLYPSEWKGLEPPPTDPASSEMASTLEPPVDLEPAVAATTYASPAPTDGRAFEAVPAPPVPSRGSSPPALERSSTAGTGVKVAAAGGLLLTLGGAGLAAGVVAVLGLLWVGLPSDEGGPDTVPVHGPEEPPTPEEPPPVDAPDPPEATPPLVPQPRPDTPTEPPPETPEEPVDDTVPGAGLDVCGRLSELEAAALLGRLPGNAVSCLAGVLSDGSVAQVDRVRLGQVLVNDGKARCDAAQDCTAYETHQRAFFEEVTRAQPEMLYAFALHLADRSSTQGQRDEAIKYVDWALEQKQAWSGPTFLKRVDALLKTKAVVAQEAFGADARDERRRLAARDAAVAWMNQRVRWGRDDSQAFALCASATGSKEACEAQRHDVGAKVEVTLVSIPMGAEVFVDGHQLGVTPQSEGLSVGDHTVKMVLGEHSSERTIHVDLDEAKRWTWKQAVDEWVGVL